MDETAARKNVRRLLLSADNTIKSRSEPERFTRARARVEEARAVAEAAGLVDALVVIDRRLTDLGADDGA